MKICAYRIGEVCALVERSGREKKSKTLLLLVASVRLRIAMSPTKPLKVMVLRNNTDSSPGEEAWEPYQEYGVKASTKDWSCFILAKEGEVRITGVQLRFSHSLAL